MMEQIVYVVKSSNDDYWQGAGVLTKQVRMAKMYIDLRQANKTLSTCNEWWAQYGEWKIVKAMVKEEEE